MVKKIPIKNIEGVKENISPIRNYLKEYKDLMGDGKRDYLGIETGEIKLDRALLGLSGVMILGGKAGGGKTTMAIHLAKKVAKKKTPVLFYSLEMSRLAITTKLLSSLAEVNYGEILLKGKTAFTEGGDRELDNEGKERLKKGWAELEELQDYLYIKTRVKQDGDINFETIAKEIEYLKNKHNSDEVFVVVDHLQCFTPSERVVKGGNQIDREIDLINGFKNVNEETKACILLITQQNKAQYGKQDITSVKGSVEIVYLADVVMFITGVKEEDEDLAIFDDNTGTDMKLVITKNRYNAPNTKGLPVDFNMEYSLIKFKDD